MTTPTDDIDRIMAVMAVAFDPAFGEAWSRRQVEDALLTGLCHYRLSGDAGNAHGFTLSRHVAGEEELLLIAVRPNLRGQGLGQQLLGQFINDARARGAARLLLEMREDNLAGALYRRHGFKPIGQRPNYYRNGAGSPRAAITFACDIVP
jgi:ribosomal-protein-alanine N-acetyltransferase